MRNGQASDRQSGNQRQSNRAWRWWPRILACAGLVLMGLEACATDPGSQRAYERDNYGSMSPYGYPDGYPGRRREYGPWDMPGSQMQPGPPTWYGCPQQSARCY